MTYNNLFSFKYSASKLKVRLFIGISSLIFGVISIVLFVKASTPHRYRYDAEYWLFLFLFSVSYSSLFYVISILSRLLRKERIFLTIDLSGITYNELNHLSRIPIPYISEIYISWRSIEGAWLDYDIFDRGRIKLTLREKDKKGKNKIQIIKIICSENEPDYILEKIRLNIVAS